MKVVVFVTALQRARNFFEPINLALFDWIVVGIMCITRHLFTGVPIGRYRGPETHLTRGKQESAGNSSLRRQPGQDLSDID
jgi:hypothetical protein